MAGWAVASILLNEAEKFRNVVESLKLDAFKLPMLVVLNSSWHCFTKSRVSPNCPALKEASNVALCESLPGLSKKACSISKLISGIRKSTGKGTPDDGGAVELLPADA